MLIGFTIMPRSTAPTPTATPAPIPARNPPLGRENPRGASEYPAFLPRLRIQKTASQNPPTTVPTAAAPKTTNASNASCESTICASNVDSIRGPSVACVSQESFLYGGRQKLDLPQLLDAHPAYLSEGRLGARFDLGVAPEGGFLVSFQRHPGDDVDRMASIPQELVHVEDTGEAGRKASLLSEFAACALRYPLARLEPASWQHPVRVHVRFLVAHQEQCSLPLHDCCDPHPEVHTESCTILAHAASIPASSPGRATRRPPALPPGAETDSSARPGSPTRRMLRAPGANLRLRRDVRRKFRGYRPRWLGNIRSYGGGEGGRRAFRPLRRRTPGSSPGRRLRSRRPLLR